MYFNLSFLVKNTYCGSDIKTPHIHFRPKTVGSLSFCRVNFFILGLIIGRIQANRVPGMYLSGEFANVSVNCFKENIVWLWKYQMNPNLRKMY